MELYQRGRICYTDCYINGQRVQTSTGTPNKREAKRFMANREIALLKHMYNLAEAWGLHQGRNPVKGIRFLAENSVKLRTLSEEEEAKLLSCFPLPLRDVVLFALHPRVRSGIYFD